MNKLFSFALAAVFMVACSAEYGKGFRTPDAEYADEFVAQLNIESISHKQEDDGFIRYKVEDEEKVKKIHERVRNKLSSAILVKYEEPEAMGYLKDLLNAKELEFKEEEKDGEVWVKWYPKSDEQKNEIEMNVVNYILKLKASGG